MQLINLGSFETFEACRKRYLDMLAQKVIHRDQTLIHCEDCSGDMLHTCKNVRDSFEVINSQDCRFCHDSAFLKDCYDVYEPAFDCELQYESYACNHGKNLIGTCVSYDVSNLYYCDSCHNSRDLFGCISLKRNQYCILNKQYSREEYERLVPKIIKQMKSSGEWGEFFPITLSPFAYNESVAQESFPITKEEAAALGYRWYEKQESSDQYLGPSVTLPDDIRQISDNISKQILICEATFKPYKIIPQELKFYRELNIPIPRKCPDQRHKERMALRNPRKLWQRQCVKCSKKIQTTYAPERPEIVYCEDCYLQTVY